MNLNFSPSDRSLKYEMNFQASPKPHLARTDSLLSDDISDYTSIESLITFFEVQDDSSLVFKNFEVMGDVIYTNLEEDNLEQASSEEVTQDGGA